MVTMAMVLVGDQLLLSLAQLLPFMPIMTSKHEEKVFSNAMISTLIDP